jgi:tetratricopeptide (TPR) repeat protein
VMLHFGPLAGLAMDSLSLAFERVLFLDPHHSEAQLHLPWAAALDGRRALLDSVTTQSIAQDTGGAYAPVWRILRAFARGDTVAEARAIAQQASMDDLQRLLAVNMAATLRDPRGTKRLALALLAAPGREPEARAFGHLMAAHLALAVGHIGAANRELAAADSLDPAATLEDRGLLALLPWLQTPDSAIRNLRARIERWNAASVRPGISNAWVAPHDSLHPQIRLYLLGALSARLAEADAAQRYAGALQRFDTTTAQGTIGRALASEVQGDLELARGKPADGLKALERSGLRGRYARTWQRAYSSPFFSQSYERFLRARALAELGRTAEAMRWYGSGWISNGFDLVYLAPGELGQAEILDRQGDRAGAQAHYRAFVALWRDADPELRPAVRRVEERIAALNR